MINNAQGLMELINSQKSGPQRDVAQEGLAGLLTGSPQAPAPGSIGTRPTMLHGVDVQGWDNGIPGITPSGSPQAPAPPAAALGGLSQDAAPSDGDMRLAMNILGQNQGQAITPVTQGGGMFDAYSPQNQTNMKMAMIADMVGNFAGKDVGAMKTMMPLAENARKLRLQGEENAAYDKMVSRLTPKQQKLLASLPVSMRPMAMKQFLEQQLAVPTSPLVSNNMGDRVGVAAYGNISKFMDASGVKKEAAYNNLRESEVMLTLLNERDPKTGDYVMQTGPGQELLTKAQAFFSSAIESFGTKGMQDEWRGLKTNVARKEFYDSVSKSKTLLKAALMKGNLSEKELDFSTDTVANLLRSRYGNILTAELSKIAEETEYNRAVHLDSWYSANLDKYRDNYVGLDAALRKEVNRWNAKDRKDKVGHIVGLIKRLDGERIAAEKVGGTPTAGADSNSGTPSDGLDGLSEEELTKIMGSEGL